MISCLHPPMLNEDTEATKVKGAAKLVLVIIQELTQYINIETTNT